MGTGWGEKKYDFLQMIAFSLPFGVKVDSRTLLNNLFNLFHSQRNAAC